MRLQTLMLAIVSVLHAGATLPAQRPAMLRGEIDLRIGESDHTDGPYAFHRIAGLALAPDGRIVVGVASTYDVRVYSPTGRHLYSAGRKGNGPGDLMHPCCLAFAPDGALWVPGGDGHYSIFRLGPAKATYEAARGRRAATVTGSHRIPWDNAGRVVEATSVHVPGHPLGGHARSVVDARSGARTVDTIAPTPVDSLTFASVPAGGGVATYMGVHSGQQLRAFGPRGEYAAATSTRYAVRWVDLAGRTVAQINRGVAGPPLSAGERAAAEDRNNETRKIIGARWSHRVPAHKPVLRELGFDLDGRLWVQRTAADGAPAVADVYQRDGRLVATMSWPANVAFVTWAIRGNVGIGVERDEDGVERVVRLTFR